MSEAKFTPGPWEWVKSKNDNWASYDLSPSILTKDTADGTPWGDEIDRANAHLIAAAPELYEALEDVLGLVPLEFEDSPMVVFAKVALAKARGETL